MLKIWWASLVVGPVLRGGAAFGLFQFRFFFSFLQIFSKWRLDGRDDFPSGRCFEYMFGHRFLVSLSWSYTQYQNVYGRLSNSWTLSLEPRVSPRISPRQE